MVHFSGSHGLKSMVSLMVYEPHDLGRVLSVVSAHYGIKSRLRLSRDRSNVALWPKQNHEYHNTMSRLTHNDLGGMQIAEELTEWYFVAHAR